MAPCPDALNYDVMQLHSSVITVYGDIFACPALPALDLSPPPGLTYDVCLPLTYDGCLALTYDDPPGLTYDAIQLHSSAITVYGDMFVWGRGFVGQTGLGDR